MEVYLGPGLRIHLDLEVRTKIRKQKDTLLDPITQYELLQATSKFRKLRNIKCELKRSPWDKKMISVVI